VRVISLTMIGNNEIVVTNRNKICSICCTKCCRSSLKYTKIEISSQNTETTNRPKRKKKRSTVEGVLLLFVVLVVFVGVIDDEDVDIDVILF
jgi:hypothetical protein